MKKQAHHMLFLIVLWRGYDLDVQLVQATFLHDYNFGLTQVVHLSSLSPILY
jgi:hypothetical protein